MEFIFNNKMKKKADLLSPTVLVIIAIAVVVGGFVVWIFLSQGGKLSGIFGQTSDDLVGGTNWTKIKIETEERDKQIDELQKLLDEANDLYNKKKYTEALSKYEDYEKKSMEYGVELVKLAKDRLNELRGNKLHAILDEVFRLYNAKSYDQAMTKYGEYLDESKKYTTFTISEGIYTKERNLWGVLYSANNLFNEKKYNEALSKYNAYLAILNENSMQEHKAYAESKIKEINSILSQPT